MGALALGWALGLCGSGSLAWGEGEAKAPAPATVATAVPVLPPEGWWVPASLKLPKAAEGRIAWRFTLREVITVDKEGRLERRPAELKATAAGRFATETPVPMALEVDERQHTLTVTVLKPQAAFFTLNPAGSADRERFDKLVVNVHADSDEVRLACDKAASCARRTDHEALLPSIEEVGPNGQRKLTNCRDALSTIRQDLAAEHRSIPSLCR
jgi:hypothetical protein